MKEIFIQGGPIMWPILFTSVIALTVVLERLFFIIREKVRRQPAVVERMLTAVERNDFAGALQLGKGSHDFIARTLVYALSHEDKLNAVMRAPGANCSATTAVSRCSTPRSPSLRCSGCSARSRA
jgi:biopolymer transport protein ExbB